jgi:hypothetical protein
MVQRRFSREEQQTARGVSIIEFLTHFNCERFSVSKSGYLLDDENPGWVGDIFKNWWYDNSENPKQKNGNIIDWLILEGYSFPEAMTILLSFADGGNWEQYIKNNKKDADFIPYNIEYDINGMPFD